MTSGLKYMGSKRVMLTNGFGEAIMSNAAHSKRVVDLFSGSAVVAWYAAEQTGLPVHAYDLQTYSAVLARAVIERKQPADCDHLHKTWLRRVKSKLKKLDRLLPETVASDPLTPDVVYEARAQCQALPSGAIWNAYGGHYFSPHQAAALDLALSLLPETEPERSLCHAGVIVAAGYCAAAPGHTAQPFQPTPTAVSYIQDFWRRDPLERISAWLTDMSRRHARRKGRGLVGDALFAAKGLKATDLVLVDPPYSAVQYSRFYHVLETIARLDSPTVTGTGRYPPTDDRPSSRFSLRTQSGPAMEELLDAIAAAGSRALITFPAGECSNGLSGSQLIDMARDRFTVTAKTVLGRFSTLGGNNTHRASRHPSAELILGLSARS